MTTLSKPLKWHGGKHYIASDLVAMMPPHLHYVERFAGGLSVLLAKDPEGVSEVVNDIDGGLTNYWDVLTGEESFRRFARMAQATPFSEVEWVRAGESCDDCVVRAFQFLSASGSPGRASVVTSPRCHATGRGAG